MKDNGHEADRGTPQTCRRPHSTPASVAIRAVIGCRLTDGSRRFLPPWRADKTPHGYVVRDANGQVAYVYSQTPLVEAMQAKVLTADEARRIARNIARLP